jgi:hypothetical protein
MFAEALTMGVQKKPEAQQEYLQTIISESERLKGPKRAHPIL